jgi:hypothetical protein
VDALNSIFLISKEVLSIDRNTLNEVVVNSSNLPHPLMRMCQKKKKNIFLFCSG